MTHFPLRNYLILTYRSLRVDSRAHAVMVLLLSLFLYGFFLLYNLLVEKTVAGLSSEETMVQLGVYGFIKIVILLMGIAIVVGFASAHSVRFLGRGGSRYASMMASASPLERYAVMITRSFIIAVFDALVAFVIADLLQWVTTGSFPTDYYANIDWELIHRTKALPAGTEPLMRKMIASAAISILFCNAWFSLCATIFKRHPFIFALLLLWLVCQIASLVLFFVVSFAPNISQWSNVEIDSSDLVFYISKLDYFFIWVIVLLSLATIVSGIATFIRMKRMAEATYD